MSYLIILALNKMTDNSSKLKLIQKKVNLITSYKVFYIKDNNMEESFLEIPNNSAHLLDGHKLKKYFVGEISKKITYKSIKIIRHEKNGYCLLCDKYNKLERSHVIGATVFKKLLRETIGNAGILISLKKGELKLCNDNWTEYLLCKACEGVFNTKYEEYAIKLLRGDLDTVKKVKHDCYIYLTGVDGKRLALYILSLYWRGALSTATAYSQLLITIGFSNYLKKCFLDNCDFDFNIFKFRICKLVDEEYLTSDDVLEHMIINPFVNLVEGITIFNFVFEGFLFQLIIDGENKLKVDDYLGFLSDISCELKIPYVDFSSVPEINAVLSRGVSLAQEDEKIYSRCIQEMEEYNSTPVRRD